MAGESGQACQLCQRYTDFGGMSSWLTLQTMVKWRLSSVSKRARRCETPEPLRFDGKRSPTRCTVRKAGADGRLHGVSVEAAGIGQEDGVACAKV